MRCVLFEATVLLKVVLILPKWLHYKLKTRKMAAASLSTVLTAPAEGAWFVRSGRRASEVQSIQLRLTPHSAPTVLFEDLEV